MNPICEKLKNFSFTGNVVPVQWYASIVRESGKPDSVAVPILADIVYWYRPRQIRDEKTGQVTQYRQRFKGDKLQKTYQEYANLFGFSKNQVKNAFDNLERLELVSREFRHVTLESGYILTNVMFVEPHFENILKITNEIGEKEESEENAETKIPNDFGYGQFYEDGINKKVDRSSQNYEEDHHKNVGMVPTKLLGSSQQKNDDLLKGSTETTTETTTATTTKRENSLPAAASFENGNHWNNSSSHEDNFQELLKAIPVKIPKDRERWLKSKLGKTIKVEGVEIHIDLDYLKEKIAYTNARIKDKRSYWSYLGKSIDGNYGIGFMADQQEAESENKAKAEAERLKAEKKKEAARIQEQTRNAEIEKYSTLKRLFDALPESIESQILNAFPETLNTTELNQYNRKGLFRNPETLTNLDMSFLDFAAKFLSGINPDDIGTKPAPPKIAIATNSNGDNGNGNKQVNLADFEDYLKQQDGDAGIITELYKSEGLNNPLIKSAWNNYKKRSEKQTKPAMVAKVANIGSILKGMEL